MKYGGVPNNLRDKFQQLNPKESMVSAIEDIFGEWPSYPLHLRRIPRRVPKELLSACVWGERSCGATGKSVAPAQTPGRTMLKVWGHPREGIIKQRMPLTPSLLQTTMIRYFTKDHRGGLCQGDDVVGSSIFASPMAPCSCWGLSRLHSATALLSPERREKRLYKS